MKEYLQLMELLDAVDQPGAFSEDEYREDEAAGENTPTIHLLLVDGEDETEQKSNIIIEGSVLEENANQEQTGPETMSWEYPLWVRVMGIFGILIFFAPVLLVPASSPVLALPITVVIQPTMEKIELETTINLVARQLEAPTLSQTMKKATTGREYQPARKAGNTPVRGKPQTGRSD